MLTREKPGQSAFGISYDEWLKNANNKTFEDAYDKKEISLEEKNRFIKKRNRRDIFQTYFKFADMRERALKINVHPDDDDCFVPVIKDKCDLHLVVAGGWGPLTAVCHGWGGGSRAVHGLYPV